MRPKLKLIRTEAEYEAALARVDGLMSARPGTAEREALDLWVHLIRTYEEEHYPIPRPDAIEAIRFRMKQQNLKPADLVPYLGSKSKVSEVLNGKRSLSMTMIRRLHEGLGIPAELLLGQPKGRPAASTPRHRYQRRTGRPEPAVAEARARYGRPGDTEEAIQGDPTIPPKRKKWLLECVALARK